MDSVYYGESFTGVALQQAAELLVPREVIPIYLNDIWFPVEDHIGWSHPRSKFVWLYVMSSGDFTKIGLATDVLYRLSGLTGSTPYEVVLHNAYRVPRVLSRRAEAYCHAKIQRWHHRGEWFAVDPIEMLPIVEAIAKLACAARRCTAKKLLSKKAQGRVRDIPLPRMIRTIDREPSKYETKAKLPPQPAPKEASAA